MRDSRIGDASDRFHHRYEIDEKTGCWLWTGHKLKDGYGRIAGIINGKRYAPKGQQMLAHRVSWIMHNGDIPENDSYHGMVVMHKCDNPSCVNPNHLKLGTQSDNVKDMIAKGRKVAGEYQKRKGIEHRNSAFKNQEDIDFICSTVGNTKALAERFGVHVCTIKRIRKRNRIIRENLDVNI